MFARTIQGCLLLIKVEKKSIIMDFCSDFRRNRNIYARCFFSPIDFSQLSPIEILVFNKKLLLPSEVIDFLSSNLKQYFTSHFVVKIWGLKIAQLPMFLTKLSELRSIYTWRVIPHNRIVPN